MLKSLSILFLVALSLNLTAQSNSESSELISRFRPGIMWFYSGILPSNVENIKKYDRLIFDLTYNDWNGDLKPFKNRWASIGLNTNLLFDIPLARNSMVSLGTGISHSLFRIGHHNAFVVDSTNTFTTYSANATEDGKKHRLGGNSLSIPLELRFRTKGWKHFKFHIGGKIGYQLNTYSMIFWHGENGKNVLKTSDYPDINRLLYSAHFRVGIRNWALFGSYNFNTLFSNTQSTQLNLVQMGLSISLF